MHLLNMPGTSIAPNHGASRVPTATASERVASWHRYSTSLTCEPCSDCGTTLRYFPRQQAQSRYEPTKLLWLGLHGVAYPTVRCWNPAPATPDCPSQTVHLRLPTPDCPPQTASNHNHNPQPQEHSCMQSAHTSLLAHFLLRSAVKHSV